MNFYLQLSNDLRYIMRITLSQLIIFFVLTGVSYAGETSAQGILNNPVDLGQTTTTLNQVLRKIEKAAQVKFVYSKDRINADQMVSVSADKQKLSVLLNDLLQSRGISYEVVNRQIVLSPLKSSVATAGDETPAMGQERADVVVTGRVTDPSGEPLIGVTVKLKGSTAGSATNVTGNYSITIPDGTSNPILVFSYLGFTTQEIAVNGRTSINVQLVEDVKTLQEVVVVGYGTQRRGDVSQAIASVDMQNLREVPVTNVTQALQGRIPGLVATPNNFRPGAESTIRLRGSRSLTAGNNPLYVVDGIPINYSIDDINPLDIESIDVLKDAAATAIYGSRGANGVIQVTTKRGKAGKLSIDYSGNTSTDNIVRELEVYDGAEFAQFRRDAFIGTTASGVSGQYVAPGNSRRYYPDPAADYAIFSSNDNMLWDNVKNAYEWIDLDITSTPKRFVAKTRPTTQEERDVMAGLGYPVLNEIALYDPSKITTYDWGNDALRTGITQNHNISVSGGSDKFSSSFGGGFFKQTGIVKSQDFTRFTLSNNSNFRPKEFLNFGMSVNYSNSLRNNGTDLYGAALGQFPLAHPYDSDGKIILNPGSDDQVFNPLNDPNTIIDEYRVNRLLANVFAQATIVKGLSYRIAFGADYNNERRGRFTGALSSVQRGAAANANYDTRLGFVWTLQNQLNYMTTFAQKHELTFTAVQELRKRRDEISNSGATGLTYESQKWYALQNNSSGTFNVSGNYLQDQLASHLGRINYSYDNKYILSAALRHDAASVLSPENNSQLFPSASVAWRLDRESFIQDIEAIDQLKLRIGFGAVGNSGIDPYRTAGVLDRPAYYNFGDNVAIGYTPLMLRSDVTWERTNTSNVGVDFGFLKGKISGAIDVYESNTNNIQSKELPAAGGIQFALVNLGNVRNRGLEIALSTINIDKSSKKGGFRWASDFTFATNKEEITELNERGSDQIAQQWFYGRPIRTYWDYKSEGIFQNADTLSGGILKEHFWKNPANKSSDLFKPGRIRVADINNDGNITDADRIHLGSPNPKWTGSINNTFSYKGFDLSSFVYISQGSLVRDFRPGLVGRYPGPKVNYWTPTNPSNEYQQPSRLSDIPTYWQSLSFRDGSFVRVRNIMLAYHVPASFIERLKLNHITVSVNAVNPFLFSKFKRYDPESVPYNSTWPQNSTNSPSPTSFSSRSFVFGVRMGL
ncbi:TonB-dependent receptor [Paradesertivirga mongoliensis]|uniref:TonB-dependent receptor n=1 Tax=Paradesertivirga mongoliensis TaxID=2100740 RepID=A0ABW4ZKM6_9SPHI|nr:TonB-dependent receptor [Pedobacter mongoliensis]